MGHRQHILVVRMFHEVGDGVEQARLQGSPELRLGDNEVIYSEQRLQLRLFIGLEELIALQLCQEPL